MSGGDALGLVETRGWVALIEVADRMAKAARVRIVRVEAVSDAVVTILVRGRLAAVRAAVESGEAAARTLDGLVAARIIANPDAHLEAEMIAPLSPRAGLSVPISGQSS